MSNHTDLTNPLLPKYTDIEKTSYPTGAFDEDDTPLQIGGSPGKRGRWKKMNVIKKGLSVILAIWTMMALVAFGRGTSSGWSGKYKPSAGEFGGLESYVYTEVSYVPATYAMMDTEEDGSSRQVNASFTFHPDQSLDLTLPEGVEGEIIISHWPDHPASEDMQGQIVVETTKPESAQQAPEIGIWKNDEFISLAITSGGYHRIHLILPPGSAVPCLNTNLPISPYPATLDLVYTSLSMTSENRDITGTFNVTRSIEFWTESGDVDVDVRVLPLPRPEHGHRPGRHGRGRRPGKGNDGRESQEQREGGEIEMQAEGERWYWPFKGRQGYGLNDGFAADSAEMVEDDKLNQGEMEDDVEHQPPMHQPGDHRRPDGPDESPAYPSDQEHKRPSPPPGHLEDDSPRHGPHPPPPQAHHPHQPPPQPHHPHEPSHPHHPPGPPSPPHHPPGPPHRGPPYGPPPALIRAHSMIGSLTLRIHTDANSTLEPISDLKKHKEKGDKHSQTHNHTRPIVVEAHTSTGSVSITDHTFLGSFDSGTIEGKVIVQTDTEHGKEIEVIRRKVGEKGGRLEGIVKRGNETKYDEDEDIVDRGVNSMTVLGKDVPQGPPPPPHSPHHPSHGPHRHPGPPPPRGPHGPHGPHGPPHSPHGPPPPFGFSRISAHTVVGDVKLDL